MVGLKILHHFRKPKSAQNCRKQYAAEWLDGARRRQVFVQGQVRWDTEPTPLKWSDLKYVIWHQ